MDAASGAGGGRAGDRLASSRAGLPAGVEDRSGVKPPPCRRWAGRTVAPALKRPD